MITDLQKQSLNYIFKKQITDCKHYLTTDTKYSLWKIKFEYDSEPIYVWLDKYSQPTGNLFTTLSGAVCYYEVEFEVELKPCILSWL